MYNMQLYTRLFSQCLFQLPAGNSHQVTFGHFHTKFLYQTVNLRKSFHLQIYYVVCALPTPSFGDNILCQSKHPEKGNSEESQKRSVCAGVLSTYPVSVLCPSHRTPVLPDPSPRQEDMRHSATTGKACLWGHVSSVAGWCHQSPLLGPPGWMGTSLLGRQDGGVELRTYEWFPKSLQLRTKRSPWVGGKQMPMHSSSRARISPLF